MPAKIAFVTGASRGIGRASAIALAKAGFDVAVSARTLVDGTARLEDGETQLPGGLDTTVKEIEAQGARGFAVPMDLLDRKSVLAAADQAIEHFGRIDLLLNNVIWKCKLELLYKCLNDLWLKLFMVKLRNFFSFQLLFDLLFKRINCSFLIAKKFLCCLIC